MQLVFKLLNQIGVKYNKKTVYNFFNTHPDHPSLLSISDLMDEFGIENAAIQISADNFIKIPTPFIAKTASSEGDFCLIQSIKKDRIVYLNEKQEVKQELIADFLRQYSGIVLVAQSNEKSGEPEYDKNQIFFRKQFLIYLFAAISITVVLLFIFFYNAVGSEHYLYLFLLFITKILGVASSGLLLVQSLSIHSPFITRLCSSNSGNGCNHILSSKGATIFNGTVSWSEIGFLYFATTLVLLIFQANSPNAHSILLFSTILALPYTLYSLFYQYKVAKSWCRLCLIIQSLIWLEFLIQLIPFINQVITLTVNYLPVLILLISSVLLIAIWKLTKPLIVSNLAINKLKRDLNQFKKNVDIFNKLLEEQKTIIPIAKNYQLVMGNPNANFEITFVSNPFCIPCAKEHRKIHDFMETMRDNIKVVMIFTLSNTNSGHGNEVIKAFINAYNQYDASKLEIVMNDWYESGIFSYNNWKEKHVELLQKSDNQITKIYLEQHRLWCEENEITHTPSVFINNKSMLAEYSYNDLKYFINL